MDFLPAGSQESERLKYTESFFIPNDSRSSGPSSMGIKVLPPHQDTNPSPNLSHPQQEQKNAMSSGIRSDIQSYLKNRGSKASSGAVSSFENPKVVQSIQNGTSKNSSIAYRESSSENVGAQKRPVQQVESKAYRLSEIDEAVFKQVEAEMGQHQIPRSNIEQSHVKVSMESQVRPYEPNKEFQHSGKQLINLQNSHIPQSSHEQLLKSIKLGPKHFEYDEDFSKPKQQNHLKRNLIPQNIEKEIIPAPISALNHQVHHEAIKQNVIPQYTPINIHDSAGAKIPSASHKINYNRNLLHNVQQVRQNSQIIIPSGQYSSLPKQQQKISHIRKLGNIHPMQQIPINQPLYLNQINHQQKIAHVQEQLAPQFIHLPAQEYQYSSSNISKGNNYIRNIQHNQPEAPVMLKLQQHSQDLFNNLNKSHSYSRNLQHQAPMPGTKVNLDPQEQSLNSSSYRRSLIRNLQHEELPQDTKIIINAGDESILSNSSQNKSKLLPRNLQHDQIPETLLYVDTGKEEMANFANKKDSSILSRNLQHQEIPQTILFANTGKQEQANFTNKKDRSILSRSLQHQQIPETLVIVDTGKEEVANFANKRDSSILSRNLQHQEIPDTHLNVHLGDESMDFAHKRDSSILSRNLQHEEPIPDTKLFINPSEQPQRLSSSRKLPLSRSLQHSQQPIIVNEQQDPALEFSHILPPNEPQSFSLPIHELLADQSQLMNSKSKSQYTRNLVHDNIQNNEEHIPISLKSEEGAVQFSQPSKTLQKRNLEAIAPEKPKEIRIDMNENIVLPKTNSSVPLKRTLQHQLHEEPIIVQQQPPQIVQQTIKINQNWGDHSGKLIQPKNQIKYQRNLKQDQVNDPHSQAQSIIPEVSQRIIQNELSQPPQIIQPQQLPLDFAGVTTLANQKQQILLKRHLIPQQNPLPQLDSSALDNTCEGWNPSSKIFHLFKLSKHHEQTGPISYGKARISTAFNN